MANLLMIRDIAESKSISLRTLATRIGISEDGLQKLMVKGSTKTSTLEAIARELEVSAGIFFDGYPSSVHSVVHGDGSAASVYGNATSGISDKDKEIAHLNALLEEKERVINEKERTIQILINK